MCVAASYDQFRELGRTIGRYCDLRRIDHKHATWAHYVLRREGCRAFNEEFYPASKRTAGQPARSGARAAGMTCPGGYGARPWGRRRRMPTQNQPETDDRDSQGGVQGTTDRRSFLKAAVTSLTGAAFVGASLLSTTQRAEAQCCACDGGCMACDPCDVCDPVG
jgi:hypothetical protein